MESERPLTEQQQAMLDYIRANPGRTIVEVVLSAYPMKDAGKMTDKTLTPVQQRQRARQNTSAKLKPLRDRGLVRVEYPDRHRAAVYPVVR